MPTTATTRPTTSVTSARAPHHPRGSVQLPALIVLIASLTASVFLTSMIAASAGRHQLVYTDRAEEGMSRDEALGVAAGAFRGLFVNILWMRANDLKEAGKYHEAVDLARTITRLQPRFPRVWAFHAWNLAYNISVATNTQQERWQWVNSGIRLLRDQGIPQNPSDLLLHKELSWIFLHKVQGLMDDANQYYKRQFAIEWTVAMGTPPERTPETRTTPAAIKSYIENYVGRVNSAHNTLDELYAAVPGTREMVATLRDQYKLDITEPTGRRNFLGTLEALRAAFRQVDALARAKQDVSSRLPQGALVSYLADEKNVEARRQLTYHLRKRLLIDEYHMEPERMVRYTEKYGPLDWRHPATHGIYWAARGVEEALARLNDRNQGNYDFINTDRMVIQSLQELYRSGQLIFDINNSQLYVTMPNDYFIPSYGAVIKEVMWREEQQFKAQKNVDISDRTYRFYSSGYENFLHDAISFLYRRNQIDEAEKYRRELLTWAGRGGTEYDFRLAMWKEQPLEVMIMENLKDRVTSPNIAVQEVAGAIQSALINGLLAGDNEIFKKNMTYAERFHKEYTSEQWRTTGVDTRTARMGVMQKDFRELTGYYTAYVMQSAGLTNALLMWARMPEDQKLFTYDVLMQLNTPQGLGKEQAAASVREFEKLFPAPIGVDRYRRERDARQRIEDEKGQTELK